MKNKIPTTLFICCCDNRIMPYDIAPKKPGELFILRNIGNLIPPYCKYKSPDCSVAAAIEFAIENLEIPEIIVCGHSDCAGMKAALKDCKSNSSLTRWVRLAEPDIDLDTQEELSQKSVLRQITNLMTYPEIETRVKEKKLTLHGWWLDLDTGRVNKITPPGHLS